jgi:hypothetical protein
MLLAGWQSLLHRAIEGDQFAAMTLCDQNQIGVRHLFMAGHRLPCRRCRVQRTVFPKLMAGMLRKTFQLGERLGDVQLAAHDIGIEAQPQEGALRGVAGGKA